MRIARGRWASALKTHANRISYRTMKHSHFFSWALLGAVAAGCSGLEPFQNGPQEPRQNLEPKWVDTRDSHQGSKGSSSVGVSEASALDGKDQMNDGSMKKEAMNMAEAELIHTVQALPTGDRNTSALLLEKLSPAEVVQGVDFMYQLHVSNLTNNALDNVLIEDRATSNLRIREADPAPSSTSGNVISWDLGSLSPQEKLIIQVRATATEGTEVQGVAQASYDSAMRTKIAVVSPALEIKIDAPQVVATGEEIPLEVTVRNTGSGDAKDILVQSLLPAGLMTADGSQRIEVPIGTLHAGEFKSVQVLAKASQSGEYSASAEASMRHGATVQSGSRSILVQEPSLEMMVAGPSKAFIGTPARWTLKVRNTGTGTAKDVSLNHTVPAGMTFMQASEAPNKNGTKLTWPLGNLDPGQEKSIDMYLQADRSGSAEVTASVGGNHAAKANGASPVMMQGVSALSLEINDLSDPVLVGDSLTYHVKVYNDGSSAGSNIAVSVELDEGMQLIRAPGPTNGNAVGQTINFSPLDTLAPGETATWRIVVKSIAAGDLRLSASLTSDRLQRPVSDNESTQFYQ